MDSTLVVVGGWPAAFLLDKPYFSPVGSVGLVAGLLGEDAFRIGPYLVDVLFYLAVIVASVMLVRSARSRRTRRKVPPSR